MAANEVFRVYKDTETMLKVYGRRLRIADKMFKKGEATKRKFIRRYENEAEEDLRPSYQPPCTLGAVRGFIHPT